MVMLVNFIFRSQMVSASLTQLTFLFSIQPQIQERRSSATSLQHGGLFTNNFISVPRSLFL